MLTQMMYLLRNPAFRILSKRYFHASQKNFINPKNVEEVKIPVPWGHIAGKWWGEKNTVPIIGLHGLLDNAATFDKLAPLLETPSLLSLDLPGHGLSSHIPQGIVFHYFDFLIWLRHIIKNHFKWEKLKLLGHSYGGSLWFLYSTIYPDDVEKFICIDGATYTIAIKEAKAAKHLRNAMDNHLEIEKKLNEPVEEYSYESMVQQMFDTRKEKLPISKESVEILLTRAAKKTTSGKYYWSRDLRLNGKPIGLLTLDFIYALSEQMTSDVLYVNSTDSIIIDDWKKACEKSLDLMKKSAKIVKCVTVEGVHHVHLEDPEPVAAPINEFLNS